MTPEDLIKRIIIEKYGTFTAFSKISDIPNSTLATILNRSIYNANFSTVMKLCQALSLDISALADGRVVQLIEVR